MKVKLSFTYPKDDGPELYSHDYIKNMSALPQVGEMLDMYLNGDTIEINGKTVGGLGGVVI